MNDMWKPMKAFVFDLDGTLLNEKEVVSAGNREALESLKKAGALLFVATGRNVSETREVCEGLPFDGYVCSNGMTIYDDQFHLLHKEAMPGESVVRALGELREQRINYELHDVEGGIEVIQEDIDFLSIRKPDVRICSESDTMFRLLDGRLEVAKILVIQSGSTALYTYLKETITDSSLILMNEESIELNKLNVHKWSGLQKQFTRLGIHGEEVVAFGDSMNDWQMLTHCGRSVAMGNADPKILTLARDITLSNREDGVAHYIDMHASYLLKQVLFG